MEQEYKWYDVEMNITVHLKVPANNPGEARQLAVRVIQGVGFFAVSVRKMKTREERVERHPDWLTPKKLSF